MQEVLLPELVAEFDDALILIMSNVDDYLTSLYDRISRGEEINYWFRWDLIKTDNLDYIVVLVVNWGSDEESLSIGFTPELWDFLGVVRDRGQLVLMTDWGIFEETIPVEVDIRDLLKPKALIINDAYSGMEKLSKQVVDEALVNEPKEELYDLLDILRPSAYPTLLN
ncbi:hypothetical protein [Desulfolucanica intricata]|uniref:hypothetical protein n=1 Tax=Desulfolucanica intricata TaxID=1285191 RepID=UPI0008332CB2|nr:hypothetical protein [Desulfolucanica intricata]